MCVIKGENKQEKEGRERELREKENEGNPKEKIKKGGNEKMLIQERRKEERVEGLEEGRVEN